MNAVNIELTGPSEEEELEEIDKKKLFKELRKPLSYYSLNPEDFKFRFSDLYSLYFFLKFKLYAQPFLRL